jgi:hypothetical protein
MSFNPVETLSELCPDQPVCEEKPFVAYRATDHRVVFDVVHHSR